MSKPLKTLFELRSEATRAINEAYDLGSATGRALGDKTNADLHEFATLQRKTISEMQERLANQKETIATLQDRNSQLSNEQGGSVLAERRETERQRKRAAEANTRADKAEANLKAANARIADAVHFAESPVYVNSVKIERMVRTLKGLRAAPTLSERRDVAYGELSEHFKIEKHTLMLLPGVEALADNWITKKNQQK